MIRVIVTLKIRPGTLEHIADAAWPLIEASRAEPGCTAYDLNASMTDPEVVVFLQEWQSRQALEAHLAAPHTARWREASKPLVVSTRIDVIHPERIETL